MEKTTILSLKNKKKRKDPIIALSCYDASSAKLIDPYVDVALVGDSLANTRLGYPNTLPVTMDEMVHHVRAASREIKRSMLVADMPFQSYESAPWEAALAAGRFIKEAGAHAIKLEGGRRVGASVKAILDANIPVMGHIGLLPQSVHQMGGYKVQGISKAEEREILKDALYLQSLGIFAVVLEGIPYDVGRRITKALKIPTIGIGAGPYCDGQILVLDDMLGFSDRAPKFAKRYAHLRDTAIKAILDYKKEVKLRLFPSIQHSYKRKKHKK